MEFSYIDESAVVVGDVEIEAGASVWPNATLRGDTGRIRIGERANVQDNAVIHGASIIEREAAVGHGGVVHEAVVAERALVGINAVVLDGAQIGKGSIVAAGSVVMEGTTVPSETLVAGTPAEQKKALEGDETEMRAHYYHQLAQKHAETSKRL